MKTPFDLFRPSESPTEIPDKKTPSLGVELLVGKELVASPSRGHHDVIIPQLQELDTPHQLASFRTSRGNINLGFRLKISLFQVSILSGVSWGIHAEKDAV